MSGLQCVEFRELAPELAVGNLCGDERAAAIAHLAECVACQQFVNAFTAITDRLLVLAPRVEPPAGFEQRVLAALPSQPAVRRAVRRLRRRWSPIVAAAAVALAFVTGGLLLDLGSGGDPAFAAADMRTASGKVVGQVVVHDAPAVLSLSLPAWAEQVRPGASDGDYLVRIETGDGRTAIRPVTLTADATWTTRLDSLDIDPDDVTGVAIVGGDGYVWCQAALRTAPDQN